MQAVFSAPVAAYGLCGARRIEGSRGNIIARLAVQLTGSFDLGLDFDQADHTRQPEFAGEATIAGQPFDLANDADFALLGAAMAFVMLDVAGDGLRRRILEACLDVGAQAWLVGRHRPSVVGAGRGDGGCDRGIGGDGVDRDQRTAQSISLAQPGQQAGMAVNSLALSGIAS